MEKLIWDDWNKNHIKKHNVIIDEVEEIYKKWDFKHESYLGRKEYFGTTKRGRMLVIVVSYKGIRKPYVVSTRDMSRKERRKYYV